MNNSRSIRTHLMRWLLLPLLGLILLSIFSSYWLASGFADSAFDDGLEETARAVAGQVEFDHGYWHLASPELSGQIAAHAVHEQMEFLIQAPDGKIIAGNPELGPASPPGFAYPGFRNAKIGGETFRIAVIQVPVPQGVLTVQVGETLIGRNELTNQILINTIVHQLVLLLLAVACVWLGVSRGLQPLEKIRTEVAQCSPYDLRKLNEGQSPDEIRPLIRALNELMQQLGHYVGSQKRFVTNAAHQLRTPLAGLQIQLELALRQANPERTSHALQQMGTGLEHAIHLTERLLTLAKAEPGIISQGSFEPVDLANMARQAVHTFRSRASAKNINLSLETQPVEIQGNPLSIMELLSNLLDNAIRYTPENGDVTVHIYSEDGKNILMVEDSGPGIPPMERERVFERFYRLPHEESPGNGLGLAIVKEIVLAHQAEIHIKPGEKLKGSIFSVVFKSGITTL